MNTIKEVESVLTLGYLPFYFIRQPQVKTYLKPIHLQPIIKESQHADYSSHTTVSTIKIQSHASSLPSLPCSEFKGHLEIAVFSRCIIKCFFPIFKLKESLDNTVRF